MVTDKGPPSATGNCRRGVLQCADQPAEHYWRRRAAGGMEQCAVGTPQHQSELRWRFTCRIDHVERERSARELEGRVALAGQCVDVLDGKLTRRGVATECGDRRAGYPNVHVAQVAAAHVHADAVAVDEVPYRCLAGLHLKREI